MVLGHPPAILAAYNAVAWSLGTTEGVPWCCILQVWGTLPPSSLVGSQTSTRLPLSCGFLTLLLRPRSQRLLRNPSPVASMLCAFCPISLPPFLPTHVHFISVLLQDPFPGCVSPLNGETSLVLNPQASLENGWSCLQSIKMEARPCLKNNLLCFRERHFSLLLLLLSFIIFKPHMISY